MDFEPPLTQPPALPRTPHGSSCHSQRLTRKELFRSKAAETTLLAAQEALVMTSAVLGEIEALSAAEAPRLGPLQEQLANLQQKLTANISEDLNIKEQESSARKTSKSPWILLHQF